MKFDVYESIIALSLINVSGSFYESIFIMKQKKILSRYEEQTNKYIIRVIYNVFISLGRRPTNKTNTYNPQFPTTLKVQTQI